MNEPKRYRKTIECDYGYWSAEMVEDAGGDYLRVDDPAYQEMKDRSDRFSAHMDELWQIVYPCKTDWEYPAQVIRHVRDAYQEMRRKAEECEAACRMEES